MAGSVSITGETIEELTITYKGRLLTPVHFGMTPKTAPPGKSYTLKVQVVKGQKKVIGRYLNTRTPGGPYSERSHNILMGTGNTKAGGISWIPFQRMSKTRTDIKKFTTISVPSMITSERTNEIILKAQDETAKRLQHNLDRALGEIATRRRTGRPTKTPGTEPPTTPRHAQSAAQRLADASTATQRAEGTVTAPSGLRCWRAQKRADSKSFSGRFASPGGLRRSFS